jgi:diguanylate cyclase (GGDEF)-like protein
MPDLAPEHAHELKVIFLRDLTAGYAAAKAAYDQLRATGTLDKPQLDILRRFFHKLAGVAAAVDLAILGKLGGACETAVDAMIAGKFAPGRHSLQLLGDGLSAVASVVEGKVKPEEKPQPERPQPAAPVRIAEGAPRVVVVDDDGTAARAAEQALAAAGYDVVSCLDPERSLPLMREKVPDLVLLDVEMPKMDGFEVCARMRKDPALHLVPIVFVTRHGDVDRRVRGLAAGGRDYLQKPFEPQELVARVQAHLRHVGEYRELTIRDALTRCYNAVYFKARLDQEMARAKRYKSRLVLGLLGVDGFKRINDSYGHPAGDAVLAKLADMLNRCLRASDVVARYTGDEFAFLLIEASQADALTVCNRLLESVARASFELPATVGGAISISVTCSIGLAGYRDQGSLQEYLQRADSALFDAKQQGRNRVLMG